MSGTIEKILFSTDYRDQMVKTVNETYRTYKQYYGEFHYEQTYCGYQSQLA